MPTRFRVPAAALFCAALLAAPAVLRAATPAWTRDIRAFEFQRLSPLGALLVSDSSGFACVDAATGRTLWNREDLGGLEQCNFDVLAGTAYGLVEFSEARHHRIEVVDLATGLKKWDSTRLPIRSSQGQFQVPYRQQLVMLGTAADSTRTLVVAVDLETGELRWQQDDLFVKKLKLFGVEGSEDGTRRKSIAGSAPPVFPNDSTMVVWLSGDGPVAVDLATGAKKWVCAGLKDKPVPALAQGYAPMWCHDGVLYVVSQVSLYAIDASTGALLWREAPVCVGRPIQFAWSDAGLVVRGAKYPAWGGFQGRPFLDVLDPKTGKSAWRYPFKDLKAATSFEMRGNRIIICADNELHAVSLATGRDSSIARFERFQEHEAPTRLRIDDEGYLLTSNQTLLRLNPAGVEQWHAYFEAPSMSGWIKLLSVAADVAAVAATGYTSGVMVNPGLASGTLGSRFRATMAGSDYQYILTNVEEGGRKKAGIVKVARANGRLVNSVPLGDKTPDYQVDEIDGWLFFKASDARIEAYKL
jgi:outer membrane protein assembly factor BamB